MAASKHPFGTCTIPALTIPIPSSQCAMPVFSQGVIPARISSRTSIPAGVPRKLSGGIVSAGQHSRLIFDSPEKGAVQRLNLSVYAANGGNTRRRTAPQAPEKCAARANPRLRCPA